MGLYRDDTGRVIDVNDAFADARGFTPLSPAEHEAMNAEKGVAARANERGIVGDINAAATGFASGATAGLSDLALGATLTPMERERVQSEIAAHPHLRTAGEIGGAIGGVVSGAGPTGYLSQAANAAVEQGLERGGVAGTAAALGAMGTEGAAQSAGQYIGQSALEDKDATVEGLAGALGTGFAFGTIGGGVALGVSKGVMAGRRMFSRVMDGEKAAKAAESTWTQASQEALDADSATARAAETKLDEIRKAKQEAVRARNEARSMTQEERARAATAEPRETAAPNDNSQVPVNEGPTPLDEGVAPSQGGMPTSVFKRPAPTEGPAPLDEGISAAEGGQVTAVRPPTTKKIPRPEGAAPSELETQLAGTKAQLDEGAQLKDIKASKGNEGNSIEQWLAEKGDHSAAVRSADREGLENMRMRREDTLGEIRFEHTKDLLGAAMARQERDLADVMTEYTAARQDLESLAGQGDVSNGVPESQMTKVGSPGKRQAVEILDNAHEEALLRARYAEDPQTAGAAVEHAHELEKLLENLSVPRLSKEVSAADLRSPNANQFVDELMGEIGKVQRYEKASAKLADIVGEASHPTSILKAKALRDAESEAERKLYDRTARATDDAETFGPEYKSPKERIRYAKERQIEAQRNVYELGSQEKEAQGDFSVASKKVHAGEEARVAANAASAKAGKIGAADIGGISEWIDLPGMPKLHDLPVIGPWLGIFLKFRTLKRAVDRMMGRVPASAENRIAALANQTRDRVARAVDRSLGVMEHSAQKGARFAPSTAGLLAERIYDDGGENPPKNAPIQKLAAARIRELSAYVATPNAIEMDVRRELRDVADPDVIAAAEQHRRAMMEYILKNAPKAPDAGILGSVKWEPSAAEAMSFGRRWEAAGDPAGVYEKLAEQQALLSVEAAETMREIYPKLQQEALQRVIDHAGQGNLNVPYRQRVQMSILFQTALDPALQPENFQITQSVYDRKPPAPPPMQPSAASPSIANPVNISQALTPALDRR